MATSLGTVELARRIVTILEATSLIGPFGGTGSTVGAILSWLRRDDLSRAELQLVLEQLRRSGHLAQFLNLVSHRDLRGYLREKQVPWEFVLRNWEPSFNDSGNFFTGFLIGAAESATWLLRLLISIVGAPFSKELAEERDKFWQTVEFMLSDEFASLLRQFLDHPADYVRLGVDRFRAEVAEHLWNLEFFEAGRLMGSSTVAVLTAAKGLRELPKLLQTLHKILSEVAELSLAQLQRLGVPLQQLKRFLEAPAPQAVTPQGFVFAAAAYTDEVLILDRVANPLGKVSRSKALKQLSGQSVPAASMGLKGLAALTASARQWLAKHDLLELAKVVLKPSAKNSMEYIDEGIRAIERFHGCTGFEKLAGSWLRGIRGSTQILKNLEKGAFFVMRYCLAELGGLPRWAFTFETSVTRLFRRYTDVLIPGLKIEFKSVRELTPKITKQLARDLITNLSEDLQRIKGGLRFVFDRDSLQVSEKVLIDEIKKALRKDPRLGTHPSPHPLLEQIEAHLKEIIVVWPKTPP